MNITCWYLAPTGESFTMVSLVSSLQGMMKKEHGIPVNRDDLAEWIFDIHSCIDSVYLLHVLRAVPLALHQDQMRWRVGHITNIKPGRKCCRYWVDMYT